MAFWKRDEIKKHPVLSILPLKSDNMQKLQETMNKQEAEKTNGKDIPNTKILQFHN